jgi:hypothetical protein
MLESVMVSDVATMTTSIAQNVNLIATSAGENGGYFYPVAGLASIAAIILYLSPPLESFDE